MTDKELRADLNIISQWVKQSSKVLDLGCGDGSLLASLQKNKQIHGYGLEIGVENIAKSISNGINVLHQDLNAGLHDFADQSFDYVIMTQALQTMKNPMTLIDEMLRVGKQGIITFPNFGHWENRWGLLMNGKMPISDIIPDEWYDTPNIHFCTLKDFETLCKKKNISIIQRTVVDPLHRPVSVFVDLFPNLLGHIAIYHIER
jgi:methionine biosynthesis protein MetW